jgi:hypothetical protein
MNNKLYNIVSGQADNVILRWIIQMTSSNYRWINISGEKLM